MTVYIHTHMRAGTHDSTLGAYPSASSVQALALPTFPTDPSAPHLFLPPQAATTLTTQPLVPTSLHSGDPPQATPVSPPNPLSTLPDMPIIPPKLLDVILTWQYTDLSELLPDQLRSTSSNLPASDSQLILIPQRNWETQKKKKRQIDDITTWVQLFSTYMLVLSSKYPHLLPELIAYQLFIIKAAKKFRYPSWLYYDTEFRKWASATHYLSWSVVNTQLYSLAFTGQGNPVQWCPICQVEGGTHTFDCPSYPSPNTTQPLAPQQPTYPSRDNPAQQSAQPFLPPTPKRTRPEVNHCIQFNKQHGNCKFGASCRYPHKCAICGLLGHPAAYCQNKRSR